MGSDKARTQFRILIIDRSSVYSLQLVEDPHVYPRNCIIPRLRQLLERAGGALLTHFPFHALIGFLPLPKLHLVLVTKKHKLGSIANRWIYGISDWTLFPLAHKSYSGTKGADAAAAGGSTGPRRGESGRYRELVTSHIDLSKDFYFSFFYDVSHSLQHNCAAGAAAAQHQPQPAPPTTAPAEAPAVDEGRQQDGSSSSGGGGLTKSVSTPQFPSASLHPGRHPPPHCQSPSSPQQQTQTHPPCHLLRRRHRCSRPSPSHAAGAGLPKSHSSSPFVSRVRHVAMSASVADAAH